MAAFADDVFVEVRDKFAGGRLYVGSVRDEEGKKHSPPGQTTASVMGSAQDIEGANSFATVNSGWCDG